MRRKTMLRRLAELLPDERVGGAFFAQTGPRALTQLAVTMLPMLFSLLISWYLALAWISLSNAAFSAKRRWFAIATTDRGVVVCKVFKPRPRIIERLDREALREPVDSVMEPSVTVGDTTYWLPLGQLDEARRMARAARGAATA
jgi:hypothetical protein